MLALCRVLFVTEASRTVTVSRVGREDRKFFLRVASNETRGGRERKRERETVLLSFIPFISAQLDPIARPRSAIDSVVHADGHDNPAWFIFIACSRGI